MSSLQARLRLAIGAAVLTAVSISLLVGAFFVRRSLEQTAFDGLERQARLLAQGDLHPSPGQLGRFLATQDERLTVLPAKQARLLVPAGPSGRITINGRDYLYATQPSGRDAVVLLRTASSVRAESRPFFVALLIAGALGCALAVAVAAALARGIARPIAQVARASRRLADGREPDTLAVAGAREVRELAESFNTMAEQLTRARAAERSFLLSVGHELKTPLTAIRGYSEALEEGVLKPDVAVKVVRTEAARLERLIADLINLARLDQRRFDIQRDSVDLAEIARESAQRHAVRARDLGVRIHVEDGRRANASADPDRLLQAVSNLVENALRCTPCGGIVTLSAAPGELTVADTGPGITADELPRAFDRFFLYRRYSGSRPVGTGLGLAIVRELAQAMGGDVRVTSSPTGTAFTISLPTDDLHALTQRSSVAHTRLE
ncbi:MAG: HAMP domain-containing histidine kinase [Actinobacteria bacterium]|nr:MAG: HAMP domain-containing histidine kinase [Actinomycetota bacterium]